MPDPTAVLRHGAFWHYYVRAEARLDRELLHHLTGRAVGGRAVAHAPFHLPCGEHFALEVTVVPESGSASLGLVNGHTLATAEMGWWDDAGWHPYALRWYELESLFRYWVSNPLPNIHPSAAFLLLAVFVGHGATERKHLAIRKACTASHYERLRLFTPTQIAELVNHTLVLPEDDDYEWSFDNDLGWVISGNYPCYSLRNRAHLGGTEGRFPFAVWSTIVAQLPPPEPPAQ